MRETTPEQTLFVLWTAWAYPHHLPSEDPRSPDSEQDSGELSHIFRIFHQSHSYSFPSCRRSCSPPGGDGEFRCRCQLAGHRNLPVTWHSPHHFACSTQNSSVSLDGFPLWEVSHKTKPVRMVCGKNHAEDILFF